MDKIKQEEIAIIVPVYNEAKVVGSVVRELKHSYSKVICVDDGSTDSSSDKIKEAGGFLIRHPINLGQGAALQTGIDYALSTPGIKYFVTFDSDGQHTVADIKTMIEALQKKHLDIVLGSRFLGYAHDMPFIKKLVLRLAILVSNRNAGIKLSDTHNGIRAFSRNFAENLKLQNPDMNHASEIIEKIGTGNYKYEEIPVTIKYTAYSRAKGQAMSNAVNLGFDMLLSRLDK